ncbi:MAG: ABC transporter ATP-binding protein [Isosphaeraceae bacterium]
MIAACLAGLLVQSLLLLPIPLLQGWIVNQLVDLAATGGGDDARSAVARAIVLALAATVVLQLARSALAWWTAAVMGRISQEWVVAMRGALQRKLMRLPMAYFDAQQTGRLMARVTSDVGSIFMFLRSGVLQLIGDLILSAAIAVLLVWLQWRLALVALVVVPLYALNQGLFFTRLRKLSDEVRGQVAAALRPALGTRLGRPRGPLLRQGRRRARRGSTSGSTPTAPSRGRAPARRPRSTPSRS